MSLVQIGGPLHGQRAFIDTPALGAVVQRVSEDGLAPIWRKYKPEAGAPTRFAYRVTHYYRCVATPLETPATYVPSHVLVHQGVSDEEALKLTKEVFW